MLRGEKGVHVREGRIRDVLVEVDLLRDQQSRENERPPVRRKQRRLARLQKPVHVRQAQHHALGPTLKIEDVVLLLMGGRHLRELGTLLNRADKLADVFVCWRLAQSGQVGLVEGCGFLPDVRLLRKDQHFISQRTEPVLVLSRTHRLTL